MVQYDPAIIQSFVEGLYEKSRRIALSGAICGALAGATLGFVFACVIHPSHDAAAIVTLMAPAAGAACLGIIGYRRGMDRSFHLRLQAQLTLCQLMTEFNTRRAADNSVRSPGAAPKAAA